MVTLNLTLLVEVSLFLIFMWVMNRFVFGPLLKVLDDRDAQLERDKETSLSESSEAEKVEQDYAARVAAIHRAAAQKISQAHRDAQEAHNARVVEIRKEEEEELAKVRADAMGQVEAERRHYPELTAALAEIMAKRLGVEVESA